MSLDSLIPELVPAARDLVRAAGAAGLQPRVTSTIRSHSEQKRLYDRYLAGQSEYPAAPPGQSAHEYGWAFDMIVTPMDSLSDVGAYWEQEGGVWGGHYGDPIHFEYPGFKDALRASGIESTSSSDSGSTLDQIKDFIADFAIPLPLDIVLELFKLGFGQSDLIDMVQNPSKAVARYPWLRALGPPFMFY